MMIEGTTRRATILIAVLLGVGMSSARAQTDADVAAVTAANNAFYTALSALDAAALEKVWAHEAYVANVGPQSKAVTIGWPAVLDAYKNGVIANTAQQIVKASHMHVHNNGNAAWVIGRETVEGKLKNGTQITATNFATSVFEKKDGRWLMVSHHAQRVPQ
jgi:ketosteroid isomerase-like protein